LFKEETIRWKKKRKKRAIFIVVALFLSGFLYLHFGGPGSNYFKLSLNRLLHPVPVFNHIIFEHNGTPKVLMLMPFKSR
jgi:hypothetical protein